MKTLRIYLFSLTAVIVFLQNIQAQNEDYSNVKTIMISAVHLSDYGYLSNDPLFLVTAAKIFIDYPIRGAFVADSLYSDDIIISRTPVTDPATLLKDAKIMAAGDTQMINFISTTEMQINTLPETHRGRKFSPLIQEYSLSPGTLIKLWATFNADELAEIFVLGDGNSQIDLFLIDNSGKIIASDLNNIDNCYISFTPVSTLSYRIELKNKGNTINKCILMTN